MQRAAEELAASGVELIMRENRGLDTEMVLEHIEELVSQGVQGLAIAPNNSPEIRQCIDELYEQGIPVITLNSDAPGSRRLAFIGMDNYRAGQTAAGLLRLMLPEGGKVALPNDPTNGGRALMLLDKAGVIKLKNPNNVLATVKDVSANPKKLKFKELEAATLPRVLSQVDLALINTNYALAAKLNPMKDALAIEGKQSPYVNILVSRPDNQATPAMKKLSAALTSPATKKFIEDKYQGAVVPAF